MGKRLALIAIALVAFTAAPAGATLQNVNIRLNKNNHAVYHPTAEPVGWSGPGSNTATLTSTDPACDATTEVVTITNKTPVLQSITSINQGGILGTLAAGERVGVCTWGSGMFQLRFGLANSLPGSGKRSLTLYVT